MLLPVEKRRRWGGAAEITRILNASHAKQCRGESGALECNSLPLKSLKFSFFQLFVCPPNVPKTQEDWILELQLRVYSWRPGYRSFCLSGCSGASWTAERGVHCPGSGHQTAVSLPRSTKPNNPLTTTSGGSTLNNSWAGEWPPPPPHTYPFDGILFVLPVLIWPLYTKNAYILSTHITAGSNSVAQGAEQGKHLLNTLKLIF